VRYQTLNMLSQDTLLGQCVAGVLVTPAADSVTGDVRGISPDACQIAFAGRCCVARPNLVIPL